MMITLHRTLLTFAMIVAGVLSAAPLSATAQESYTAKATVGEGCTIRFAINKPPGLYTVVFHGRPYPLADVTGDADIDLDGIVLVGKLVQYLAEPAYNRPKLAITQIIDGETLLKPIIYDDETLSEELNRCFTTDTYTRPTEAKQTDSKSALVPNLAQLRAQAKELNLDIADYYNCQCGQAFSAVQMQSPPWREEALVLETGTDSCVLRTDGTENIEYLRAGGSSATDETNCAALLGMHTRHTRSNFQPKIFPKFSVGTQQACYNIIVAKARQWLSSGGQLQLFDAQSGNTMAASTDNLSCEVPQ